MKNKCCFIMAIILFILSTLSICSAQVFYNSDNRVSIDLPDNWIIYDVPDSNNFTQVVLYARRNDLDLLSIMFSYKKFEVEYRTLKDMPQSERVRMCNELANNMVTNMRNRGFTVSPGLTDANEHVLLSGVAYIKNGKKYVEVFTYFIRDHVVYCVGYNSLHNNQYIREAVDVMSTLTIDGIPLSDWIP